MREAGVWRAIAHRVCLVCRFGWLWPPAPRYRHMVNKGVMEHFKPNPKLVGLGGAEVVFSRCVVRGCALCLPCE